MSATGYAELPEPSRLGAADVARLGLIGILGRPVRAALSAAGIAIGVAAMIAVLGIGASSRASLLSEIQQLGTNMLTAQPGQSLLGGTAQLPVTAVPMATRVAGVQAVSAVGTVQGAAVYRTDLISPYSTAGISVDAARLNLLSTLHGSLAVGIFLNAANDRYPVTVLGSSAASLLGIDHPGEQVYLGGRWFTVIGILRPAPLAPDIDRATLVGWSAAQAILHFSGNPTTVYVRAADTAVNRVSLVLADTVDPQYPEEVQVSRPSDALTAELAAKSTFDSLFLGLGAVALLVGGIGVANIMVISVLERRQEIGLRRALGASTGHIRLQFLTESVLLALLGGIAGVALGAAIAVVYAASRGWPAATPWQALAGGIAASVAIGSVAGLYPARRASRVSPAVALATG
jgi:putative ABC transport system permease protein